MGQVVQRGIQWIVGGFGKCLEAERSNGLKSMYDRYPNECIGFPAPCIYISDHVIHRTAVALAFTAFERDCISSWTRRAHYGIDLGVHAYVVLPITNRRS